MNNDFKEKLLNIRLLVLDFDGVLTDNRVFVDANGNEFVACNKSDSLGIELLQNKLGISTIVISKEKNKVVKARCNKLSIECFQGVDEKLDQLERIVSLNNLSLINVAYIGNDLNDVPCLKASGLGIAVNDSHITALSAADYVLKKNGGHGAVREFIDLLLELNNHT